MKKSNKTKGCNSTDVTVRFVPRFGGPGSIRFRYNKKKQQIYHAWFLFNLFWTDSKKKKKNPYRSENTKYYIIMLYIYNLQYIYTYKE